MEKQVLLAVLPTEFFDWILLPSAEPDTAGKFQIASNQENLQLNSPRGFVPAVCSAPDMPPLPHTSIPAIPSCQPSHIHPGRRGREAKESLGKEPTLPIPYS